MDIFDRDEGPFAICEGCGCRVAAGDGVKAERIIAMRGMSGSVSHDGQKAGVFHKACFRASPQYRVTGDF